MSNENQDLENHPSAGEYLVFKIGKEFYGICISMVQEILGELEITRVPKCPQHITGVANLRGKVTPVLDLRLCLGQEPISHAQVCTVVVQLVIKGENTDLCMVVDELPFVVQFDAENIEESPKLKSSENSFPLRGIGRRDGIIVLIFDPNSLTELGTLGSMANSAGDEDEASAA